VDFFYLFCVVSQTMFVDAVALFAHEAFAGELEENTMEFHRVEK
jgi:hypothetical protein